MRGVLKANPGLPFLSRRIRPPVPFARLASSWTAACAARAGVEFAGRRKSQAVLAMTTFMMASPYPVADTAPDSPLIGCGCYADRETGAVSATGYGAGFPIGIATTTDERGIADPAGKLAAGATGGSCGEQAPLLVERDGADRTLFVAAVMLGGMGILAATFPGFALGGRNECFRIAEGDVVFDSEAFGAFGDEHHVRRVLEDRTSDAHGVSDVAQTCSGTGAKRGRIHHDGVAFDLAVEIQM